MSDTSDDNVFHSWMYHMRRGAFEEAWQCSDAFLQSRAGKPCWHLPRHEQYVWNGSSLAGKRVLVRCYHGLGDTIQFIRFAPLIKQIAKEVIVWVQPALISLLKTADGIDRLLPLHNGTPDVEYDVDVEVMELAHIFRVTVQTLLSDVPYLHVNPLLLPIKEDLLQVGLVWKAGGWDTRRDIPFDKLLPLFDLDDIQIIILQDKAEDAGWEPGWGMNTGSLDLYDYARLIKGLDLVISIDSMPVHLAGALGVPVWNLLHSEADWRWMDEREDSPWYPTMKLFRQSSAGDWKTVIQCVKTELQTFLYKDVTPV